MTDCMMMLKNFTVLKLETNLIFHCWRHLSNKQTFLTDYRNLLGHARVPAIWF